MKQETRGNLVILRRLGALMEGIKAFLRGDVVVLLGEHRSGVLDGGG